MMCYVWYYKHYYSVGIPAQVLEHFRNSTSRFTPTSRYRLPLKACRAGLFQAAVQTYLNSFRKYNYNNVNGNNYYYDDN